MVAAAAKLASERLVAKGLAPLQKTTPHTLRRTYISRSRCSPSKQFERGWVMDQVGHADSTMTMDVYAQLQKRADREQWRATSTALSVRPRSSSPGSQPPPESLSLGDDWATGTI